MSIEKEVFPYMASDGQLHAMELPGFWMDVGQPKDFLTGTGLYLSSLNKTKPEKLAKEKSFIGNVLIDPSAKIGDDCKIGPNVVIGPNVIIGDGVRLQKCVIMESVLVKDHAWVMNSIVGWRSTVGKWSRLEGVSVLGDDVQISDEVYLNGATVLPHKSVSASVPEPKIIM
jgi:mannose-1-phosphate guanylyltransferase